MIRPATTVHIPYILVSAFFSSGIFLSFLPKGSHNLDIPAISWFFLLLSRFSGGSNRGWFVLLCSILLFTLRRYMGREAGVLAGFVG